MKPSNRVWASASSGTSTRGAVLAAAAHQRPRSAPCRPASPAQRSASRVSSWPVARARSQVCMKTSPVKNCETACGQRYVADVPVAQHPVRRRRVVEQRLHLVLEVVPGAGRVLVDRRAGREVDVLPRPRGRTGTTRRGGGRRRGRPSPRPGTGRPTGRAGTAGHDRRRTGRRSHGTPGQGSGHGGSTRYSADSSLRAGRPGLAVMNRHTRPCASSTSRMSRIASTWMALRSNNPPISGTSPTTATSA